MRQALFRDCQKKPETSYVAALSAGGGIPYGVGDK